MDRLINFSEMLFHSLHKVIIVLYRRNIFLCLEGNFSLNNLNVHKSDENNLNKGLPFALAFNENDPGDTSIYQQIEKSHLNKYFNQLACSVRIGKYWTRSFFRRFMNLACGLVHKNKDSTIISPIRTSS